MLPYQDKGHPGNKIRQNVKCLGCGKRGCVTAWGPWCFECNVARMDRIDKSLAEVAKAYGISYPPPQGQ